MPEVSVSAAQMGILDLITSSGFAATRSEARRLIEQNAVTLDGEKINKIDAVVELKTGQVLRVGKRRFGKIVVKG
jgi:tyrosyl-tRNA synthetase